MMSFVQRWLDRYQTVESDEVFTPRRNMFLWGIGYSAASVDCTVAAVFPFVAWLAVVGEGAFRGRPRRIDPLCDPADGDGNGTCRNGEAGYDQLPQEIHRSGQGDWLLDDDLRWFGALGLPDSDRGSFRNNRMT